MVRDEMPDGPGFARSAQTVEPHDAGMWQSKKERKSPEVPVCGGQYALSPVREIEQGLVGSGISDPL